MQFHASQTFVWVDVRIIAATNVQLQEKVAEKQFRADLYYQLNVFPIALAALRDRKEDIPQLLRHFVQVLGDRIGRRVNHIPGELLEALDRYHWPGNIRELQNFVERSLITSPGDTLTPRMSELQSMHSWAENHEPVTLADAERAHIERVLQETNGRLSGRDGAAVRLGLPRTTLIYRMQKLGITKLSKTPIVGESHIGNIFTDGAMAPSYVIG